jgi:hypothetical protein
MSKFVGIIVGGIEVAAGVIVGVVAGWTGAGLLLAAKLITAGAGMFLSGLGTLISGSGGSGGRSGSGQQSGFVSASRNPIANWNVIYGRSVAGGTVAISLPEGESR